MQIVRVTNVGSTTFKGKYDNEFYVIQPGQEALAPYAAMVLWAGDPTARNISARQKNRTLEYTRLRTKYGAYENDARMAANAPQIEFHTMEGERVWTVLDDPDGEHTNPNLADQQSNATITAQLSQVQGQMAQLMDMIATGKLVLADTADNGHEAALDQMGADAAERAWGLAPTPESNPPLVVTEPVVGTGDDGDDGSENNGPPMGSADPDAEPSETVIGSTPPVDEPKSVKVGGKNPTK